MKKFFITIIIFALSFCPIFSEGNISLKYKPSETYQIQSDLFLKSIGIKDPSSIKFITVVFNKSFIPFDNPKLLSINSSGITIQHSGNKISFFPFTNILKIDFTKK